MKEKIKELQKLLKDNSTTAEEKQYAEELITWLIAWVKIGKPNEGPSTQDDGGSTPPPPPPHK